MSISKNAKVKEKGSKIPLVVYSAKLVACVFRVAFLMEGINTNVCKEFLYKAEVKQVVGFLVSARAGCQGNCRCLCFKHSLRNSPWWYNH